ncbi:MAG: hypothetical protein OHK0053_38350 [Microscillaceae bacterium]
MTFFSPQKILTGLLLWLSLHTANAQTPEASLPQGQVFFYYHAAELNQKSRETLEEWARFLLAKPAVQLQVKGHSCATAKNPAELALARAQAVADFLQNKGVSGHRLLIEGLGASQPALAGPTEFAHIKNRRVILSLSE